MKTETYYQLGTKEASEALIKDLYIELRTKVNKWAELTKQTPQARMGYIGQHLVSVVTGYPGGKTGARGRDLVMDDDIYGEIKTCYKVDQLGCCKECGEPVSSLEDVCSSCGSTNIERKDDSKWLIGIRNDDEFKDLLVPEYYYFVLFEFEDYLRPKTSVIDAKIWRVNPKTKGFIYCMLDYYLNIRPNSKTHAPFNMWPHSLKFAITQPHLIYQAKIYPNDEIKTLVFPTLNNTYDDILPDLKTFSKATTLDANTIKKLTLSLDKDFKFEAKKTSKNQLLASLEKVRKQKNILNSELCDAFADAIYLPLLKKVSNKIPDNYKAKYKELKELKKD